MRGTGYGDLPPANQSLAGTYILTIINNKHTQSMQQIQSAPTTNRLLQESYTLRCGCGISAATPYARTTAYLMPPKILILAMATHFLPALWPPATKAASRCRCRCWRGSRRWLWCWCRRSWHRTWCGRRGHSWFGGGNRTGGRAFTGDLDVSTVGKEGALKEAIPPPR